MSSLLSLEEVLLGLEDADKFAIASKTLQRLGLLGHLGDNDELVDAVIDSVHQVSLHSNNSYICNYA